MYPFSAQTFEGGDEGRNVAGRLIKTPLTTPIPSDKLTTLARRLPDPDCKIACIDLAGERSVLNVLAIDSKVGLARKRNGVVEIAVNRGSAVECGCVIDAHPLIARYCNWDRERNEKHESTVSTNRASHF